MRHREYVMQYGLLLVRVVWLAKCMAEWPAQREHTGCLHQHRQFMNQCQRSRSHTTGLDFACEQSHGPRTNRSGRDQDSQVDVRLREEQSDLVPWNLQIFWILDKAKAVMGVRHPANDARHL